MGQSTADQGDASRADVLPSMAAPPIKDFLHQFVARRLRVLFQPLARAACGEQVSGEAEGSIEHVLGRFPHLPARAGSASLVDRPELPQPLLEGGLREHLREVLPDLVPARIEEPQRRYLR